MLGTLLEQKKISAYALSKKSGIPYSTISDIVNGKTDIKNVSARILYNLSKALDVTMEQLYLSEDSSNTIYLYNKGRNVFLVINNHNYMYMGPKNLIGFKNINAVKSNTIYVDAFFTDKNKKIYVEEDYIDLADILEDDKNLLEKTYIVELGKPDESKAEHLIKNAFLVSDNMCILESSLQSDELTIEIINAKRNKSKAIVRLSDYAVLYSNMSANMLERALDAVKRNKDQIIEEIEERKHAKVHK